MTNTTTFSTFNAIASLTQTQYAYNAYLAHANRWTASGRNPTQRQAMDDAWQHYVNANMAIRPTERFMEVAAMASEGPM